MNGLLIEEMKVENGLTIVSNEAQLCNAPKTKALHNTLFNNHQLE